MARLLLRLLLILSLVMNGVAAPSAMARMRHADAGAGHRHALPAEPVSAAHAGHESHRGHTLPAEAPPHDDRGSCCDGLDCDCGCVLPPMLARTSPGLPAIFWTAAPATEPATRFAGRGSAPPFRPPAA
jgi:hypothetical protein